MKYLKLKDILYLFDSDYEIYFKGSMVGTFNKIDTVDNWCLDCRVCAITGNDFSEDYEIFQVYLTEDVGDRMF